MRKGYTVDLVKGPDGPVGWEQFHLWLQKATYQGREFYTLKELDHATQRFNKLIRLGRLEIWHLLNDGTVTVVKTSIPVLNLCSVCTKIPKTNTTPN
ncbi:hypothetical protein CY35_12G036200 [Sphagnum magellanicum]|nr:hypothetical protein CY35_12G036200 [Sphagnum magellanicum]